MSDRDEFYNRFSKSYDKLHQSEKQDDLVERVARVFWETPGTPDDRLRAAIAVALEEAADAVGAIGDHADAGAYINAIRALIPTRTS